MGFWIQWFTRCNEERIGLFTAVVGKLQPILATISKTIAATVLSGSRVEDGGDHIVEMIKAKADEAQETGFDIDEVTQADLDEPYRPEAALNMADLDKVIRSEAALPSGISAGLLAIKEYAYSAPGMAEKIRVTTDPAFYEEHAESVELWSPGSPLFPETEVDSIVPDTDYPRIGELLSNVWKIAMDCRAELALIKQNFEKLLALHDSVFPADPILTSHADCALTTVCRLAVVGYRN